MEALYLRLMKLNLPTSLKPGPGVVITGAFIGPGTVTLCLMAGVTSGVSLLWALLFSTFATILLQDMVVRLALQSQQTLETLILRQIKNPVIQWMMALFIFFAIIVGNSAYQSGNLAGTSLGISFIFPSWKMAWVSFFVALFCILVLLTSNSKAFKNMLGIMVLAMSLSFLAMAVFFCPNAIPLIKGLLLPTLEDGQLMLALGLVGTTVVPYNLFLHSSLVFNAPVADLPALRKEGAFSIFVGGLISMAIVIVGNKALGMAINNAADMAAVLQNAIGSWSLILLGIGLFAAGLSSALTAPMAAGSVASGLWNCFFRPQNKVNAGISVLVVMIGAYVAITQVNNLWVIKTAQVINGLLLPVFISFILWLLNDRSHMKSGRNTMLYNLGGFFVLLVSLALAIKTIISLIS